MGQYWKIVNLDKREFLNPHKLGSGLKLWEQVAAKWPGVALTILVAAQREKRGGGDLDLDENWHGPERKFPQHNAEPGPMPEGYQDIAHQVIGRWAGDRIAIVGDYAEDSDLAPEHHASAIYTLCRDEPNDIEEQIKHLAGLGKKFEARREVLAESYKNGGAYTDISELVCRVIEHELDVRFEGDGWRNVVEDASKTEPAK